MATHDHHHHGHEHGHEHGHDQVHPTLPDEAAYRLAKALHRGEKALAQRLPQAAETTAANTAAAVTRPELLHPGVARYLREAGLLR